MQPVMDIFLPDMLSFCTEESLDMFVCAIADIEHAITSISMNSIVVFTFFSFLFGYCT